MNEIDTQTVLNEVASIIEQYRSGLLTGTEAVNKVFEITAKYVVDGQLP